jgi:hypothetical protein
MADLTDDFFKDAGFDTSGEPFRKETGRGVIAVYKNYCRDGSGDYDGYIYIRPQASVIKTEEEIQEVWRNGMV